MQSFSATRIVLVFSSFFFFILWFFRKAYVQKMWSESFPLRRLAFFVVFCCLFGCRLPPCPRAYCAKRFDGGSWCSWEGGRRFEEGGSVIDHDCTIFSQHS